MNFKIILLNKNLKQVEIARILGTTPDVISLQINKRKVLPVKYRARFCEIMGISLSELEETMKEVVDCE